MSTINVLLCKSGEQGRWSNDRDPTGWWMSEKLDGLRAVWDGKHLISRYGNIFPAPSYFTQGLPDVPLDGELWLGYHMIEETSSIVRNGSTDMGWEKLTYRVFDIPETTHKVEERWTRLRQVVNQANVDHLLYVEQIKCRSPQHLVDFMVAIMAKEGEGVMLRQPGSYYEPRRSSTIYKFKRFLDAEAEVVGYEEINVHTPSNAHLKGATGKLICWNPDLFGGQKFKVGSGLTDALRLHPPPIGTTITFRYQEVTGKNGVPRHARYLTRRDVE
jgi:DNA ligase 1